MEPKKAASQLEHAFRSPRLFYRALENDDEDGAFFDLVIQKDPVAMALSDDNLFRPQRREMSTDHFLALLDCPLAVMICLPQRDADEGSDPTKPKLIPVGILTLQASDCKQSRFYYHHHRNMDLSINIAGPHQDRGYGSEAVNWALDWAFRHAGMHTVSLSTVAYNERAMHLYKKLGFVLEGRHREAHFHDRRWWDEYLYSMTEGEWEVLRGLES